MSIKSYSIGFDLGGSSLKYGYGNKDEGLLYFEKIYHREKSLNNLIDVFRQAFADLERLNIPFVALGLASPGIIDVQMGNVLGSTPNLPYLKGVNLKRILHDITSLPIYVDNDANLMAFAEADYWDSNSLVGITIGSGIGTGFVYGKEVFRGNDFKAMEAGHIIVVPNGRQCLCGKQGCLEAYCSVDSIRRILSEQGVNIVEIVDIINNPSEQVQKAIMGIIKILAIGLANLVMVLNPKTIAIGGGLIEIDSFDFEYLKNETIA
ncbi:MAG: ROK family protein, partial [Candidatus Cloacimonetes bacterium]|nr:ROK family protein [Candidatus Cloacimonadota bacterium]